MLRSTSLDGSPAAPPEGHDADAAGTAATVLSLGDLVAMCVIGFMTIGTRSTAVFQNHCCRSGDEPGNDFVHHRREYLAEWTPAAFRRLYYGPLWRPWPVHCQRSALWSGHWAHWPHPERLVLARYLRRTGRGCQCRSVDGSTNALLAQWFKDWRALAMSINNAGGAVGPVRRRS